MISSFNCHHAMIPFCASSPICLFKYWGSSHFSNYMGNAIYPFGFCPHACFSSSVSPRFKLHPDTSSNTACLKPHPSYTLTWFTVDIPYVRKGSRKQKPQSRLSTTSLETKKSSETWSCTIFFPFVVLFSFSSYLSSHRVLILFKYVPLLVSSSGPVSIRLNTVASNWPFHNRPCALKSTFHTRTTPTFLPSSSRLGYIALWAFQFSLHCITFYALEAATLFLCSSMSCFYSIIHIS